MALGAILSEALVIGLAAGFVAAAARVLAPSSWTAKKPFGCALCMGWWSALILWAIHYNPTVCEIVNGTVLWPLLASAATAALVNGWIVPPRVEGNLLG